MRSCLIASHSFLGALECTHSPPSTSTSTTTTTTTTASTQFARISRALAIRFTVIPGRFARQLVCSCVRCVCARVYMALWAWWSPVFGGNEATINTRAHTITAEWARTHTPHASVNATRAPPPPSGMHAHSPGIELHFTSASLSATATVDGGGLWSIFTAQLSNV